MNTIALAVELGKFPYEIDSLPCDEYDRLLTYYAWKRKEEKKQQQKMQRKQGRK